MTKVNESSIEQSVKRESKALRERAKDSKTAIIYFLSLIIVILLGCLGAEHLGYIRLQDHDNTTSADDLNGQNPANTYATPGTTTGTSATTSAAASTSANNQADNKPDTKNIADTAATSPAPASAIKQ